jgi:inorganic pyrophosphatase
MEPSFLLKNSARWLTMIRQGSIDRTEIYFKAVHGKRFETMRKLFIHGILLFFLFLACPACIPSRLPADVIAEECRWLDERTLAGSESFLTIAEAVNPDGTLNVVVEIPAGTIAKWEVDKADGTMRWETEAGRPRRIDYLGYPGNYGMIPKTHLAEELGGDGDPLDVIVLGASLPRGSVVQARAVGVLRLLDDGERDDKIMAVRPGTSLGAADALAALIESHPGIDTILETWFSHYKGKGRIVFRGFDEAEAAMETVRQAAKAFQERAAP